MKFRTYVYFDLNGTIIAGDEKGGKSPNKSILTDLLECYPISLVGGCSAKDFKSKLFIDKLNKKLQSIFNKEIDVAQIIDDNASQFTFDNFYENFKHLLNLCKVIAFSVKELNELLKIFLVTEKEANHDIKYMELENVCKDENKLFQLKAETSSFHGKIDEDNILTSFYDFANMVHNDSTMHLVLNTFGNEAPKVTKSVVSRFSKNKPTEPPVVFKNIVFKGKDEVDEEEDKNDKLKVTYFPAENAHEVVGEVHNTVKENRFVAIRSSFDHYNDNNRRNNFGKPFPVDSKERGVYFFFDDNLTHEPLDAKGCVHICDVRKGSVNFTDLKSLKIESESKDIQAKIYGEAIVVLVRARLSITSQKGYFTDLVKRYQTYAEKHYSDVDLRQKVLNSPLTAPSGSSYQNNNNDDVSLDSQTAVSSFTG